MSFRNPCFSSWVFVVPQVARCSVLHPLTSPFPVLLLRHSTGSALQRAWHAAASPPSLSCHGAAKAPSDGAQDPPLTLSLGLTASLCSLCFHLWLLLLPLTLHREGDRRGNQIPSQVSITEVTETEINVWFNPSHQSHFSIAQSWIRYDLLMDTQQQHTRSSCLKSSTSYLEEFHHAGG